MAWEPTPPPLIGYEPDWTVYEAWQAGKVVTTNGDTIGIQSGYTCDMSAEEGGGGPSKYCMMEIGHDGPHMWMRTWHSGYEVDLAHLMGKRDDFTTWQAVAQRSYPARVIRQIERRIAVLEPLAKKARQEREQREREQQEAIAQQAKQIKSLQEAKARREAVALEREKAKVLRRETAKKAAEAEIERRALQALVDGKNPPMNWGSVAGRKTKRKQINPKGQRR